MHSIPWLSIPRGKPRMITLQPPLSIFRWDFTILFLSWTAFFYLPIPPTPSNYSNLDEAENIVKFTDIFFMFFVTKWKIHIMHMYSMQNNAYLKEKHLCDWTASHTSYNYFFSRHTNFIWKNYWQKNHSYSNLVIWQDIFSKMNQVNLSFQEKP